jgi:HSP20 family protein
MKLLRHAAPDLVSAAEVKMRGEQVDQEVYVRAMAGLMEQPDGARLDVVEKGDVYEIKVDLPGVKKGDIQIDLNDNHVAISAAARTEREVKDGEVAIYSERQTSQFARSFDLPQPVMEDKADASFEDGVLTLKLPKKKTHTGRRLAIR